MHFFKMQVEYNPILHNIASHPRNYLVDTLGGGFKEFLPQTLGKLSDLTSVFFMGGSTTS